MRVPNLQTAPKRHLIKIRTFLKKIDSYLKKYKFARRFKGLTNLKLLLSIQILCASHYKFVQKYVPPPGFETLEFQNFSFILHHKYPNNLC